MIRCPMVCGLIALMLSVVPARAQKKAPDVNPQAPVLSMPMPMGIQRGTALDLTLTGSNLADPVELWTSIPGTRVNIPTDNNNGKDNAKLRVRLEVPATAPLGFHALRLATKRGISNLRLFCVDELPQVLKVDTNRSKEAAQVVSVPCVVAGRMDAERSDFYKFHVKAGQRLSFDVLGHRLGSAFDPQLTLHDAKTGRELPGGHSNDEPGLQTDARKTYTFKEAGDYLVEVRDVMFRGAADYCYRLRIGDFPCATTPLPLAAKRGSKVMVQFAGPNVEGVAPVEVTVPADPEASVVWVAPRGPGGLHGWPVALAISDHDEILEQEPNNEPAKANRVPVPGGVSGCIQARGDVDHFVFALRKGQRYRIEAQTYELFSPAEVTLELKNAMGGDVAKSNLMTAPRLDVTAPADGDFTLGVGHLNLSWGGPSETYRIVITPATPEFSLSLGIDRIDVPQGGVGVLAVTAVRDGYTGPIELNLASPAGLSGQSVIPAGQTATLLAVNARPDAALSGSAAILTGKAVIDGKPVVRTARVDKVLTTNLGVLLHIPPQLGSQVGVCVTEKSPFTLAFQFAAPEGLRGGTLGVTVRAVREAGFVEDIVLAPLGLPAGVAPAPKNIAKNQTEAKVELKPAANAPLGSFPITFTGKAKFKGKDYLVTAPPATLVVTLPFELKVSPAMLTVAPGGKAKVMIQATRKGGYAGPIAVELRNLPAGVTAPKATIMMGQAAVEIEVSAAATAVPVSKADAQAFGTASAAANQPNTSPAFTVIVKK